MPKQPSDHAVRNHPTTTADILRRAGAQADRLVTVNDRQKAALGRHIAYLEDRGLMDDFNDWQGGRE